MTYQELLQQLADQASTSYKEYLQSKIKAQQQTGDLLIPEQTQQYKDAAETYEKKFTALLAMIKNGQPLDEPVNEEDLDNFLKQ